MAIVVTPNLTEISNCDQTTGWSAGALNDAFMLEGTGCLGVKVSEILSAEFMYTLPVAGQDLTDEFIIMTMLVTGLPETLANGGYRIVVEDGVGNTGTWYVAGSDTHPGGWGYFAVDPSTYPTLYNGTANTGTQQIDFTDIDLIGVQFNVVSKAVGNAANVFWDICHYGTGLTITSAATDGATFDDLYAADDIAKYGIITRVNGVYFLQGLITLDDGATGIDFTPDGDWVVWKDNAFLPDSFNGIAVNGFATGTVNVNMANCVMKGDGVTNPYIDFSDTDIDSGTIVGCTFVNFAPSTFIGMTSISGSAFDLCGQVTTESCVISGGTTFRNSVDTGGAFLWPLDSDNAYNLNFVNNDNAVEYATTSDATPTFTDCIFDDVSGKYDVNNTDSAITIVLSGTSNANSFTGSTVTFSNPKSFKFTVNPSIIDYEWRIYSVTALGSLDGSVELDGEENATTDNQTYNYNYSSDTPIAVQIISQPDHDYEEEVKYYTLVNGDQDVSIDLTKDNNN